MWTVAAAILIIAGLVAWEVRSSGRYYRAMFAETHFREFYGRLERAIDRATRAEATADRPSASDSVAQGMTDDPTRFVTSAGLVLMATSDLESGERSLHLSLSQRGRSTTHSVCGHFGSFIVAILNQNHAALTPVFTDSGVHHLAFRFEDPAILMGDFDTSYRAYQESTPLHYKHQSLEGHQR